MNVSTVAILLHLLLLALSRRSSCSCHSPSYLCGQYQLYQKLEKALVHDNQTLLMLQRGFFPQSGHVREAKEVVVVVQIGRFTDPESPACGEQAISKQESGGETAQMPGQNETSAVATGHAYRGTWDFFWSKSALLSLVAVDELLLLDSSVVSILVGYSVDVRTNGPFGFTLFVDSLMCVPSNQNITETLSALLTWLKAYARARGKPSSWDEWDKGHVELRQVHGIRDTGDLTAHCFRILLVVLYISLNVQMMAFLAKLVPKYYRTLARKILFVQETGANPQEYSVATLEVSGKMNKQLYSLFWACVCVATGLNLFNGLISAAHHTFCGYQCKNEVPGVWVFQRPQDDPTHVFADEEALFLTKLILVPTLAVTELIVAICVQKVSNFPIPNWLVNVFCCCCCCPCRSDRKSKAIQTFALWQIMVFLQGLVTAAIPVGAFLVVSPVRSVSVLLFLISLLLSSVVVLAHFFQICSRPKKRGGCRKSVRNITFSCVKVIAILSFIVSIFAFFTVFVIIFWRGISNDGLLADLAISLVSVALDFVIGWHVKNFFTDASEVRQRELVNVAELGMGDRVQWEEQPELDLLLNPVP